MTVQLRSVVARPNVRGVLYQTNVVTCECDNARNKDISILS